MRANRIPKFDQKEEKARLSLWITIELDEDQDRQHAEQRYRKRIEKSSNRIRKTLKAHKERLLMSRSRWWIKRKRLLKLEGVWNQKELLSEFYQWTMNSWKKFTCRLMVLQLSWEEPVKINQHLYRHFCPWLLTSVLWIKISAKKFNLE